MRSKAATPLPSAEAVLRFLESNPDFLIDHRLSANPGGSSSGRVIALSRAVIRRAQDSIRESQSARINMADITAANMTSQAQVFQTACLLMAAQSVADIAACIRDQMPPILDIHAARLVVTPESPLAGIDGVMTCPVGVIPTLTGGDVIRLGRPHTAQAAALAAVMPEHEVSTAVACLPDLTDGGSPPMMLVLIGRSDDSFSPAQGTALLAFTATLIAVALIARKETP